MAKNQALGALVDPMGHAEALSQRQYETLKNCLEMHRSEDSEVRAIAQTIEAVDSKHRSFEFMMRYLLIQLDGDADGLLITGSGAPVLLQETEYTSWVAEEGEDRDYKLSEAEVLAALVKILRAGGWFGDWLSLEITNFVPGNNAAPTPLKIMGSLTNSLGRFKERAEETHEMLELYPREFAPVEIAPAEPAKPAEPKPVPQDVIPDDPRRQVLTIIEDATHKEESELTPGEFRELKKHLAAMRARKPRKGKAAA